ncbi:hypothetical protein OF83DRAFT_1285860 [Amylostereum chailletii]|nr:hypothetical protein OF83DRAFT_1285860 [Amylostereum chailletii]
MAAGSLHCTPSGETGFRKRGCQGASTRSRCRRSSISLVLLQGRPFVIASAYPTMNAGQPWYRSDGTQEKVYNDPVDRFWALYLADADKKDTEMTDSMKGDTDGILIFKGLFAATVAAFIIEFYKTLSADSEDDVVAVLSGISNQIAALSNGTRGLPHPHRVRHGCRLIPADVYASEEGLTEVERAYVELLAMGVPRILGNIVAGGKVAENAHVHSAIHPGWRTAKTHMIAVQDLPETFVLSEVEAVANMITHGAVRIHAWLAAFSSIDGDAAYSNEADVREPDFQAVFYGRANYARLEAVKRRYDPTDMWIVGAGVGSERWDVDGMCTV